MTYQEWLNQASAKLEAVGINSATLDARLMLAHQLQTGETAILAHPETNLAEDQCESLAKLLQRRVERQPLAQILGQRQFYGLDLEITPDVLTPRVETELMVELAAKNAPANGSALDIGTGSGGIAIALAKQRPDLKITASDISPAALKVARRNARQHQVKINFLASDLFDHLSASFDVITANLPYLADDAELMPEVQREPAIALLGGQDGLEMYRRFFQQVMAHINDGSLVLIEADPWQHPALIKLATSFGLTLAHEHYFILGFQA